MKSRVPRTESPRSDELLSDRVSVHRDKHKAPKLRSGPNARYEHHITMFLAFFQLACFMITLNEHARGSVTSSHPPHKSAFWRSVAPYRKHSEGSD